MAYRVLLADESPAAAKAVQAALPEPEFEVRVAAEASKAEQALEEALPDALLAALSFPAKDGYELGARFRSRPGAKAAALIFLRGIVEGLDVGRLAAIDHDGVVRKPFDAQTLAAAVRRAIEKRREIPSLPEEPSVQRPAAEEPESPPERITISLDLAGSPLEDSLRGLVREEFGRAEWDARMREIASAEFKKLLVAELREFPSKK